MIKQTIALPQMAPVTVPMVLHMFGIDADEFMARVVQPSARFLQEFRALELRIAHARKQVLEFFDKELQIADPIANVPSGWFRAAVPDLKAKADQSSNPGKPISERTLRNWCKQGVLRSSKWGELDLDSAAGALMVLSIDPRERHTFPTVSAPDEPAWWCLSQAPPTRRGTQAQVIPRPVPYPELEPGTLLWAPNWPSFSQGWLRFSGVGAIRFVDEIEKEELGLWDPNLRPLFESGPLSKASEQAVQTLAQAALYKLAVGRLGVLCDCAPLWPRSIIWPHEVLAG